MRGCNVWENDFVFGAILRKTGYQNETAKTTLNNKFCWFFSFLNHNTETIIESLNGRRILTVGLPTVKIVNKFQLRLILYFDSKNFLLGSQKLHSRPPHSPPLLCLRFVSSFKTKTPIFFLASRRQFLLMFEKRAYHRFLMTTAFDIEFYWFVLTYCCRVFK